MKITEDHTGHPLYPILIAALEQAMYGKGKRHGGVSAPFLDQPMFHYIKMHGRGFATGQAAKKLEEAASTRKGDAFEHEVLGAIVYAASAILAERQQDEAEKALERVFQEAEVPKPRGHSISGEILGPFPNAKPLRHSIDDAKVEDWSHAAARANAGY